MKLENAILNEQNKSLENELKESKDHLKKKKKKILSNKDDKMLNVQKLHCDEYGVKFVDN
jgi:hypothetical protein